LANRQAPELQAVNLHFSSCYTWEAPLTFAVIAITVLQACFAYHNIELRVKLFDFTSYLLPGTVGLTLFNDFGRVWAPGESSAAWHDGYGAGIYIRPAQLALIQIQAGHSPEGWQPYITLGFRF